jgi:putative peptidoglycan lipid II flippase
MTDSDPRTEPPQRPEAAERPHQALGRFLADGLGGRWVSAWQTQSVAGAAGIVALGFIGSRLLGLVRSVAIADAFGTDPELSAYWVAFRLPDLVFQVLAGATLSAAFIPVFSRVAVRHGEEGAWRLASSVLNLVSIATVLLAGLAFLLAPWIVPLLAPGLGEETGREAELRSQAIELTRFMMLSPLFFGVSGMLTGILNARQHFVAPAVAPMIYNLSIILGAVFLADRWGVHGLAWGVVIGSLGHLLVQVPALASTGMRWTPSFEWASEAVQDVLRLMGPRVIGLAATQINFIVVIFFASFISDEAISAMNYAFLMMMLPVGVVGMAISTAVFPTLSQQAAASEFEALRRSTARALRTILFLAIPASAGLLVLAEPSVRLLLERGAFDVESTDLVVGALMLYALGVFGHAGIEILSRGFYALSDTRTPVSVAVGAVLLNIALSAALVAPFGVEGLALAASVTAAVEFFVLVRLLQRRLGGWDELGMGLPLTRTVLATAVMAEVIVIARLLLGGGGIEGDTFLESLVVVVVAGGLGGASYLGLSFVMNRDAVVAVTGRGD